MKAKYTINCPHGDSYLKLIMSILFLLLTYMCHCPLFIYDAAVLMQSHNGGSYRGTVRVLVRYVLVRRGCTQLVRHMVSVMQQCF